MAAAAEVNASPKGAQEPTPEFHKELQKALRVRLPGCKPISMPTQGFLFCLPAASADKEGILVCANLQIADADIKMKCNEVHCAHLCAASAWTMSMNASICEHHRGELFSITRGNSSADAFHCTILRHLFDALLSIIQRMQTGKMPPSTLECAASVRSKTRQQGFVLCRASPRLDQRRNSQSRTSLGPR